MRFKFTFRVALAASIACASLLGPAQETNIDKKVQVLVVATLDADSIPQTVKDAKTAKELRNAAGLAGFRVIDEAGAQMLIPESLIYEHSYGLVAKLNDLISRGQGGPIGAWQMTPEERGLVVRLAAARGVDHESLEQMATRQDWSFSSYDVIRYDLSQGDRSIPLMYSVAELESSLGKGSAGVQYYPSGKPLPDGVSRSANNPIDLNKIKPLAPPKISVEVFGTEITERRVSYSRLLFQHAEKLIQEQKQLYDMDRANWEAKLLNDAPELLFGGIGNKRSVDLLPIGMQVLFGRALEFGFSAYGFTSAEEAKMFALRAQAQVSRAATGHMFSLIIPGPPYGRAFDWDTTTVLRT